MNNQQKQSKSYSYLWKIIIFILIIIGGAVGTLAFKWVTLEFNKSTKTTKSENIEAALLTYCNELNKSLPKRLDEETILIKAHVKDKSIIYTHSVPGADLNNIDINALNNSMRLMLTSKYKSDPKLAVFRENKIILTYEYRDAKNTMFASYSINPDDF